jgi:FkbM family methyltransferase
MKAFIDLGALHGDTIISGMRWYPRFDVYYAFEPLAENFEHLVRSVRTLKRVVPVQAAADTVDGEAVFYLGMSPGRSGGSLCQKSNCFRNVTETVKTVDMSRFVMENVAKDDYVVMKCDIEGKEYDVLERMCETGAIEYIDELFCEWHFDRINVNRDRHDALINRLNEYGFGMTGYNRLDEFHYVVRGWESVGRMRYEMTRGWPKWKLRLRHRHAKVFGVLRVASRIAQGTGFRGEWQ